MRRALTRARARLPVAFGVVGLILALASPVYAVVEINHERAHNTLVACQAVNARHDATIKQLHDLIDALPPAKKAKAKQSVKSTVLLINALAPKRDCSALVKRSVGN